METLATKSPSEWGGNANPFGEDVDLGLLLQSSKDQRIWVEGLGDLDDLSFLEVEERESKRADCS